MLGLNTAGGEFKGAYSIWPKPGQIKFYADRGVEFIRLPIPWTRFQPLLNGPLDPSHVRDFNRILAEADEVGLDVIVDLHAYARHGPAGNILGAGVLTGHHIADFWRKLLPHCLAAKCVKGYDIMNEPHDLPGGTPVWRDAAQIIIGAICEFDKETDIHIEGNGWASASGWVRNGNNILFDLEHPGGSNKLVFQAHQYADKAASGVYANGYDVDLTHAMILVDRLKGFVGACKAEGKRAFVGELGVPSLPASGVVAIPQDVLPDLYVPAADTRWVDVLVNALSYLKQEGVPATLWAGGLRWTASYKMQLHVNPQEILRTGQRSEWKATETEAYRRSRPFFGPLVWPVAAAPAEPPVSQPDPTPTPNPTPTPTPAPETAVRPLTTGEKAAIMAGCRRLDGASAAVKGKVAGAVSVLKAEVERNELAAAVKAYLAVLPADVFAMPALAPTPDPAPIPTGPSQAEFDALVAANATLKEQLATANAKLTEIGAIVNRTVAPL